MMTDPAESEDAFFDRLSWRRHPLPRPSAALPPAPIEARGEHLVPLPTQQRSAQLLADAVARSKAARDADRAVLLDALVFDSCDLAELPEPEPLIAGVIDAGESVVLAGKFGTYKTFVTVAWACAIATGTEWDGHSVPKARAVIYVAAEGSRGIRKRIAAWKKENAAIPRGMLIVVAGPAKLNDSGHVAWLADLVRKHDAGLVVFDTLHRVTPGVEENSSAEMGLVTSTVLALAADTGCAVVLVHHTGHSAIHARGSSSLEDDLDGAWIVDLAGDPEDRSPANVRRLVCRKRKDAALAAPRGLTLRLVEGTGSGVLGVVLDEGPAMVTRRPGRPAANPENDVLAAIRAEPGMTFSQIKRLKLAGREATEHALKVLAQQNLITVETGARGSHQHYPVTEAE